MLHKRYRKDRRFLKIVKHITLGYTCEMWEAPYGVYLFCTDIGYEPPKFNHLRHEIVRLPERATWLETNFK